VVYRRLTICCAALIALFCCQCGSPERDNPFDPARSEEADQRATLSLYLPLPKPLVTVVHRIVAILEGPDIQPIVKELSLSPLGPATATIGTIQPGSGRVLTLRGYDLEDNLIFEGQQEDITISAGDTTRVEIQLELAGALADTGEEPDGGAPDEEPPDVGDGETPDEGVEEEEIIEEEPPEEGTPDEGAAEGTGTGGETTGEEATEEGGAGETGTGEGAG